jgi:hypothetical protein
MSDDGTVSISTQKGVMVHKEEVVLITCKGGPILIGVWDGHGRYQIPLMQQWGQWQPQCSSKQGRKALGQAKSVYNLPSTCPRLIDPTLHSGLICVCVSWPTATGGFL